MEQKMRKKLLELLSRNGFMSGEKIAEQLGVSRTAVWKQINTLKEMGYKITSVKNKGYHLESRPDIPYPEEVCPKLNTKIIGKNLYYFKTLSSTNLYAKELINKGAEEGTVVVADTQTKGKGRKNREWFSPSGGLWFSVILYPEKLQPNKSMLLTMAASIAVVEAIKTVTETESKIKWPNDVLINNKKVCGILTELDAELDKINHAIIGIGINVNNELKKDLKEKATTLRNEVGTKVPRVKLLKTILKHLDENYAELLKGKNDVVRKKWIQYSKIVGKKITVKDENTVIKGVVEKVDEEGYLILQTKEGKKTRILSGDIEYTV
ncbi:MAG TPA: biotin--[acetyl-CoA-carboxylase] ligase [Thermoplasmatales archaeon]|nr:biotin--[acetyl-CoA-carboxylase] ligase [Thermoplasmatales archaeon]